MKMRSINLVCMIMLLSKLNLTTLVYYIFGDSGTILWSTCCSYFLFCLSSSCVLCTQCCQCLWIVHSWFPLRFSVAIICISFISVPHRLCETNRNQLSWMIWGPWWLLVLLIWNWRNCCIPLFKLSFYIIRKTTSEANENAGCGLGHAQRCMSLSYLPIVFIYINCSKCILFNNIHLSMYYTEDHKLISSFEKGARTAYLSWSQSQNIGKLNNLKVCESKKIKGLSRIAQFGYCHLCPKERRTLILMIITLFRNCKFQTWLYLNKITISQCRSTDNWEEEGYPRGLMILQQRYRSSDSNNNENEKARSPQGQVGTGLNLDI